MTPVSSPDRIAAEELYTLEAASGRCVCVFTADLRFLRASAAMFPFLQPEPPVTGMPIAEWNLAWQLGLTGHVAHVGRTGRALALETPAPLVDLGLPPSMLLSPIASNGFPPMAVRVEFRAAAIRSDDGIDTGSAGHTRAARLECLGVLAGGVAHQFNNLLLGILGHSELLVRQCTDPEAREQLEPIRQAALKARELTRKVLGLLDCRDPRMEALELDVFLDSASALAKFGLASGVRLIVEQEGKSSRALADPDHLLLVLLACVREAGAGLGAAGDVVHIRFGQLADDEPRPTWIGITGYGNRPQPAIDGNSPLLAEAQRSTLALNGRLECMSNLQGQRSFRLSLPAASRTRHAQRRDLLQGNPQEGEGAAVLVIDDEAGVREVVAKLLQSRGYSVITANTGQEGLARFAERTHPVSLVLLDLSMPGMTGQETCQALLAMDPDLRIVLMSGVDTQQHKQPDLCGARAFLSKPFSIQTLFSKLQSVRSLEGDGVEAGGSPEVIP